MSELDYRDEGMLDALDDECFNARQRKKRTSDEEYADRLQALADEDAVLARAINCK
jgi:hypothetical protein